MPDCFGAPPGRRRCLPPVQGRDPGQLRCPQRPGAPGSRVPGSRSGVAQLSTASGPPSGRCTTSTTCRSPRAVQHPESPVSEGRAAAAGRRAPAHPTPRVVALLGPSLVLVGRLVGCDHGDQVGLAEREVIGDPALPGGQGFGLPAVGRIRCSCAVPRSIRSDRKKSDCRIRCPSRRRDLYGVPAVSCRGGSLPSARAIHSALTGQLVRPPDRGDNEGDPSAVRGQHRGGRRAAIDHELFSQFRSGRCGEHQLILSGVQEQDRDSVGRPLLRRPRGRHAGGARRS